MNAVVVDLPLADAAPPRPARKKRVAAMKAAKAPPDAATQAATSQATSQPDGQAQEPAPPEHSPAPMPMPAPTPFHAWSGRPGGAAIAELCEFIVGHGTGGHLAAFARSRGFAHMALLDWLQADPVRAALYDRAREERADILAEEVTEIADAPADTAVEVARSRLRVEARKWAAARLKPRVYGDRAGAGGAGGAGEPPLAPHVHEMSDEALLGIARRAAGKAGKGGGA